ncbi:glycosyltransferase family 39 protein [Dactylosporangium vinaceum]|uniref:Glycosyltransferase family 39 protein n=1 Tax=Dactylosporangium vinaceum TaxID=53362 RepID=A0ABV5M4R5_9ACTN|nr:glycosyltransferase family 39 protein [Dactylosporangium vinaceum]UAB93385.1 glycosyltransferase family 39 protein [Dactylosporangium vinaceum]
MTTTTLPRPAVAPPPAPPAARPVWQRPALAALLLLTGVLYLWRLGDSGYANSFYAAAVQAGTQSWKALLFGSLDAGNVITVDKPPASLWIMGLSGRVFGFNSWSLLVPQALEGVAAVALLYATVKRHFGAAAGLLAGAALALTPVAVLMFRFDNPDALLTLLLVAGAYCTTRAVERAAPGWLALAATALGFAFLTKMLQGLLVLPGFALAYLIAAPTTLGRRLLHLLSAGAALVVSAGWFVALVALWPASSRPYIGGSTDNSLLELALGYNGLGRILGGDGNRGGGGGGGFQNVGFGGATGITRLFGDSMGTEISWLLPAALVALIAGLWFTRRAPRTDTARAALIVWGGWLLVSGLVFSYMSGTIHPYYTVALAPAIAALVAIAGRELWRARAALPARLTLAALVFVTAAWDFTLLSRDATWTPWLRWTILVTGGAAAVALASLPPSPRSPLPWRKRAGVAVALAALLSAFAGTTAWAVSTAGQPHTGSIPTSGPTSSSMGGGFGLPGGGLPGGGAGAGSGFAGGGSADTGTGSGTGPGTAGGGAGTSTGDGAGTGSGFAGGGGGRSGAESELIALLKSTTTQWAAATTGDQTAAELELATGKSVIAIGGWDGSDPAPTLAQFKTWVSEGRIAYYVPGGRGGGGIGGGNSDIASWVAANYTATAAGNTTVYKLTS